VRSETATVSVTMFWYSVSRRFLWPETSYRRVMTSHNENPFLYGGGGPSVRTKVSSCFRGCMLTGGAFLASTWAY